MTGMVAAKEFYLGIQLKPPGLTML